MRGGPRGACGFRRKFLISSLDRSFGRDRRLLTSRDFQRVFERPARSEDRCFVVLARARGDRGHPRLGLAVAKRQVRRANRRNRLKRVVRESFRVHQHRLTGLDVVVIARAAASAEPGPDLGDSLRRHWTILFETCGRS